MKKEERNLTEKAVEAMKSSVRAVVDDHRRRKQPLATWEDGKVVYRDADSGHTVHEESVSYGTKPVNGGFEPKNNRIMFIRDARL